MNLVDADILYDKFVKLEEQALGEVNKYVHDEGMVDSFKRWSTILYERSAYKYDIIDMPRVDAVLVIRCKDCKYYGEDGDCWHEWDNDGQMYYQSVINEPNPDDYCSRAERREENGK